jgi:hypothetical protein
MKHDYRFFEETLHRLRRLRSNTMGSGYLLDAPKQMFPEQDFGMAPKLLSEDEDHWGRVVLTRSYARKPGKGLARLEALLQNQLPEDFRNFHRLYDEALLTTRTYPIHLWSEERMLEEIDMHRDLYPYPLRFFRFGEYWDQNEIWFGLWQSDPTTNQWKVMVTGYGNRDDDLDHGREDEYIIAPSFYAWLKDFIARDGIPDPYKNIGPEGGFLDPA